MNAGQSWTVVLLLQPHSCPCLPSSPLISFGQRWFLKMKCLYVTFMFPRCVCILHGAMCMCRLPLITEEMLPTCPLLWAIKLSCWCFLCQSAVLCIGLVILSPGLIGLLWVCSFFRVTSACSLGLSSCMAGPLSCCPLVPSLVPPLCSLACSTGW